MKPKRNLIQMCLLGALLLHALNSGAQTVTNIAAGSNHSLFLKSDGSLWAMGYNAYGDLGDGTYNNTNWPERIVAGGVKAIAAGDSHSLFIKTDGSLWAMGYNGSGQLGDGKPGNTNRPEQIVSSNVKAIAAGSYHSLFLKTDGSLWTMGDNEYGQLGDGYYTNTNLPQQIVAGGVKAIAGGLHSLILMNDGSLWAMGANRAGQLGDGTNNNVYPFHGPNRPEMIVAGGVTAIAAGIQHSLFLESDGSLWGMGENDLGQLGDGTYNNTYLPERIVASGVTAIAAGGFHSLFLMNNGSLWVMGLNDYGQLGDGTYNNTNRPEQIVSSNVTMIAAGQYHSLFLKSDGSLWAMGYNYAGQLGDGITNSANIPVLIIPNVQYMANPAIGPVPLTVQFSSLGVDTEGKSFTNWNWNFGDGSTSSAQNPSHVYTATGRFYPSLAVTNNHGGMVRGPGPSIIVTPYSGLILNGDFETGDFTGWTLSGAATYTSVGDSHISGITPYSGSYEAALGTSGALGYLSQTLPTTAGASYLLSFWFAPYTAPGEFLVSWNGNTLLQETNPVTIGWTNIQYVVAATGTNTVLQFGFEDDYYYVALDNISLTEVRPGIIGIGLSGTNLVVNGANGLSGATYHVLMSTNLQQPMIQWAPISTNTLSVNGNFTITATNAVNSKVPNEFFILQKQ